MNKVSIFIPFKNTEHFLTECLDSIINQTYSFWEVMAVDDHSEDGSYALVKNFSEKDARIKVLTNQGNGIIPALQTAYAHSQGTFVTRMDSDDIMMPQKLETMVNSLQTKGLGYLSVGKVRYFSKDGISNGYARYEAWLNNLTEQGANFRDLYKECVIPSPCWMIHRSDFKRCGGFASDRYPEDYDLTFRFYEQGLEIIPCDTVLHLWRDYTWRTSRTHVHYAQNYFLALKTHYFLRLNHDKNRPLVVWGAGFKGKTIAQKLLKKGISFTWLCDNPKKINKTIYGQPMHHFSVMETMVNPQSIVTVANEEAQNAIKAYLKDLKQQPMEDYFFFC
ncbi:MAG: glycosyltransferase family 2 protein [Bacteroidota bacterium]